MTDDRLPGTTQPPGRLPRESRRTLTRLAAALLITTTLAGGAAWATANDGTPPVPAVTGDQPGTTAPSSQATPGTPETPAAMIPGFRGIVARVIPAVVNVSTTAVETVAEDGPQMPGLPPGFPADPRFQEFFRHFFAPDMPVPRGGPAPEIHAQGSGFIIDPTGYIVTNNHVIDHATAITVTLNDGTQHAARLVGRDQRTDLALLKIDDAGDHLPTVGFGDSDTAQAGDWVLAVGNPFGLGGTVTAGIVSARGRDLHSGPFDDFLQIDAPINRGNSGGPTFNLQGEVIGINTAIYSPNGGSVGIGFAIPSDMARMVVAQLREHGRVDRGWIGVQIQPVTEAIASALGLDHPEGALVAEVLPDGPASHAGFRQGDVIRSFNGTAVHSAHDLPRLVAGLSASTSAPVVVWRDGHEETLTVTVAQMPQDMAEAGDNGRGAQGTPAEPDGPVLSKGVLGMALAPLDRMSRREFRLPRDARGVLVTAVDAGSPAAENGIAPGDVIVRVGDTEVQTPEQIETAVREAEAGRRPAVLLLVNHGGDSRFVALNIGHA